MTADHREVDARRQPISAIAPTNGTAPPDDDRPWVADLVDHSAAPPRRASTILDVLQRWRREGPLVHQATGLTKLDELTGGGPVFGERWYVLGAPDSAKTLLLAQLAHVWMHAGLVVGILAIDEEDGDLVTRFVQRTVPLDLRRPFFSRRDCETRTPELLDDMGKSLEPLDPFVRFYGPEWTIESAAEDLDAHAKSLSTAEHPRRCALFVDSIQQASCNALCVQRDREPSPREMVSENVRALRSVGARYRLITMATSEMNRNAYRNVESAEEYNDMAAAKESGAIEYSGRVLLSLRSPKDHGDLVRVRLVKNKHGPAWPREPEFYWRIDRLRQQLSNGEAPAEVDREEKRDAKGHQGVLKDAASVAVMLAKKPGIIVTTLYSDLAAEHGSFSEGRANTALSKLGAAVVPVPGSRRAKHLYLNGAAVPQQVMAVIQLEERPRVAASTAPEVP